MNILAELASARRQEAKNQSHIMTKVRYRKQDKTKRCSMKPCPNPAIKTVMINEKQTRLLCGYHWAAWQKGQIEPPKPTFIRGSQIDKS